MVAGRPIWEIIKNVERNGSIIKIRVHCKKIKDKWSDKWIKLSVNEGFLRRNIHVLFLTQGVKCTYPDKIEFIVQEDFSKGDYYVVDLVYDTELDKEQIEQQQNFISLLV